MNEDAPAVYAHGRGQESYPMKPGDSPMQTIPDIPRSVHPTDLAGILAAVATDMISRGFQASVSPTSVTISAGDRTFRLAATDLTEPADGVPPSPIADLLMRTRVPVQVPPVGGGAPAAEPWEDWPREKDAGDRARDQIDVLEFFARYSEG